VRLAGSGNAVAAVLIFGDRLAPLGHRSYGVVRPEEKTSMRKWLLAGTVALATLLAPQSFAKKSKETAKSSKKKNKKKTTAVTTPIHLS